MRKGYETAFYCTCCWCFSGVKKGKNYSLSFCSFNVSVVFLCNHLDEWGNGPILLKKYYSIEVTIYITDIYECLAEKIPAAFLKRV